jgi:ABC-type transport system involved in Fe-S cluster assembly fused permease/ATPase subunit
VRHSDALGQSPEQLHSTLLFAFAWSFACARKQLINFEILGLSLITLVFTVPFLALGTAVDDTALLTILSTQLLITTFLLVHCVSQVLIRNKQHQNDETTPFLAPESGVNYGSQSTSGEYTSDENDEDSSECSDDEDEVEDSQTRQLRKSGSWITYLKGFKIVLPFLIPKGDFKVQACLVACGLCLIGDRFLNVLVPRQLGIAADRLFAGQLPYLDLATYLALNLLHNESGLGLVQSLSKIPIEQFSYRQLTNAAFKHIMGLEMEFHADRDSAEVMKAIEQGEALTNVLEISVLHILPPVLDLSIAFVLLYLKFNSSIALSMLIASLGFLALEVVTSSWNIGNRRRVTKAERKQAQIMHQAVQGWQTVSAFNMLSWEMLRFGGAVERHLDAKTDWSRRDALIKALMDTLLPATFFLLACLVAHEVYEKRASPGDFVFLIQYWDNLIWPIMFLSSNYHYLMSDIIDAERLLDLLMTKPGVIDKEGAPDLAVVEGRVEFENVNFSYDLKRTAIRDVNISAAPGETIALVGTTGSGKSTLMKLLFRFYDVTSGCIKIDGQDIRDITQGSLRGALGLVPQDPLLFNASILENLRYAKTSASDEEIYDACGAAAIHDKIATFTDGYNTKVGEQGMKLSGGEVQRLAIARIFLKDPSMLILDEATSAVDMETETLIQNALKRLCATRTTFIIAHRLSTVVRANQILVLHEGTIVERGTHQELLDAGGRYHNLWQRQLGGVQNDVSLLES